MRNVLIISIALSIVLINAAIGHYYGVPCLALTPIVLILVTALLAFGTSNIRLIPTILLSFALIALHDMLLIWCMGGRNDDEGMAWIRLSLFAGLLPSLLILWAAVARRKQETPGIKITAMALFVLLMAAYLALYH